MEHAQLVIYKLGSGWRLLRFDDRISKQLLCYYTYSLFVLLVFCSYLLRNRCKQLQRTTFSSISSGHPMLFYSLICSPLVLQKRERTTKIFNATRNVHSSEGYSNDGHSSDTAYIHFFKSDIASSKMHIAPIFHFQLNEHSSQSLAKYLQPKQKIFSQRNRCLLPCCDLAGVRCVLR